jgi:hypothetical protein
MVDNWSSLKITYLVVGVVSCSAISLRAVADAIGNGISLVTLRDTLRSAAVVAGGAWSGELLVCFDKQCLFKDSQASRQAASVDWAGVRGAVPETTEEVVVAAVEFWALTERAAKKVERMMVENFMFTVVLRTWSYIRIWDERLAIDKCKNECRCEKCWDDL